MARRLWIAGVKRRMVRRATVGVFGRRAKSLGVSTATLSRRWVKKPGIWGRRARLARTFAGLRRRRR